jgi:hypothetical protein
MRGGSLAESDIPAVDWGGAVELFPKPPLVSIRPPVRRVLDRARFRMGEKQAEAELVSGFGVSLELKTPGAAPLIIPLGVGNEGSLRTIDFGFARCLTAHVMGEEGETLAAVSPEGELLLNIGGESASISEGVPTLISSLGTRRGHERRTRWEISSGSFTPREDGPGFYTHEPFELINETDRAAALIEETALGLFPPELLTPALRSSAGEEGLKEYLGEFSRVLVHPLEEPRGSVTLGLVRSEEGNIARPAKFRISFSEGLIDDVAEL